MIIAVTYSFPLQFSHIIGYYLKRKFLILNGFLIMAIYGMELLLKNLKKLRFKKRDFLIGKKDFKESRPSFYYTTIHRFLQKDFQV